MSAPGDEHEDPQRERVGSYHLEEVLGHGGMGIVYRAISPEGAVVAVKLLQSSPLRRRSEIARFQREARIRIDHPNVVQVLDAGVDDDLPWIAFELLEGESLSARLEREPLGLRLAVDLARQVAAGLAAAHAQRVIHRDLKPSNLFLCRDGTLKIIDFGIARLSGAETQLTMTGNVLGTPTYLSPEQAQGQRALDERTDLWSLGVCLYEMVAGRTPFERASSLATMLAVMIEPAPPLGMVVPSVPPGLSQLVARCLHKEPEARWPDATSLADALAALEVPDLPAAPRAPFVAIADTSPALPAHSASITPGEERLVAVLLAERVLDRDRLKAAVQAGGGHLLPVMGDRAIGLFGGETLEGDEVQRAAGAALDARSAARWIAVASGRASYSGETGIAGSALNSAERGCAARVGGVAIDPQTARVLSDAYDVRAIDGEVFEIVDRSSGIPQTFTPPAMRTATIGREAELVQMRAALEAVREEERAVAVLVSGPPGIGKSHLRWEMGQVLAEDGEEFRLLSARAEPGQRQTAFSLWESALRGRAAVGVERWGWPSLARRAPEREQQRAVRALVHDAMEPGPEAEECAVFFAELMGVQRHSSQQLEAARRDPQLMHDRLRLALEDWLAAASAQGPVAVLLEDLHWADAASLSLLEDLSELLADAPLLVFATARPELLEARPGFLAGEGTVRISPRGLSRGQVGRLAQTIAGRPLPGDVVAALAARTAGNPLFVEQIVSALKEEGRLDEDAEDLPLPLTVEAAVQSRLDHLPAKEKDLCKRAAVFERIFTSEDLEALGVFEPLALLSSLSRRELFSSRARSRGSSAREYRFRSPLVRDVAYRLTARSLREDLHLRVASRLAGLDGEPEETALHFERARRSEDAAAWYARATALSARRGDAPSVLRCAEKALALGPPRESLFPLHMARSESLEVLGRLEEQLEAPEAALAVAGGEAERGRALTDRAIWSWRSGAADEGFRMITEAVEVARASGNEAVLAIARGRQAAILIYAGRLDEAEVALDEAAALSDDEASPLRPMLAGWRAQLATARGDLGERRAAYRQAAELYQAAGDLRRAAGAEMNLADAYNRVGAYAEAERALRDALDKCRRVGNRIMEGYALLNLGYALSLLGRHAEALEVLEAGAAIAADTGESRLGLAIRIYRVRALLPSDAASAVAEAQAAVEDAEGQGLDALRVMALMAAARVALVREKSEDALACTVAAMELRDRLGSVEEDEAELFLMYADALERSGRPDDANAIRAKGRERVRELAAAIADEEWRGRFLDDVPAHRRLLRCEQG